MSTGSRYKITKAAESSLSKSSDWMYTHKDWQGALGKAKHDADGEKLGSGKKNLAGEAPGLHLPTVLLVMLIIAQPEPCSKIRELIGRLDICWTFRPCRRRELSAESGKY